VSESELLVHKMGMEVAFEQNRTPAMLRARGSRARGRARARVRGSGRVRGRGKHGEP
jgi:hypothetical protein